MYNKLHKWEIAHQFSKRFLTTNFLPFQILYWLLSKLSFKRKIIRKGCAVIVPIDQGVGLMNLLTKYESWLDPILNKLVLDHPGVFLDVGANTGQTLLKVIPFHQHIEYFAFEPNTHCAQYLINLCALNDYKNVVVVPKALSDAPGKGELLTRYADDILATTSHSFRKFTHYSTKQTVPMVSGDDWITKHSISSISVLKIDVEGGEYKVLKGFERSIFKYRPIIICEILPLNSKSSEVQQFRESSATGIIALLQSVDYRIFNISNKRRINHIQELSDSLESSNYICASSEISIDTLL